MKKGKFLTGTLAFVGILILILESKTALEGAKEGIALCIQVVIPSLFPFFLLSILLTSSLMGTDLPLLRPLGKLFSLPVGGESILIPSFLGGYPVGAQTVSDAYQSGRLGKEEAQRLLAFCSNAGPAFLFGMVGPLFSDSRTAWLLWGVHILSALLVSTVFSSDGDSVSLPDIVAVSLSSAMRSSVLTMSQVCGWVVLFRVILAFLDRWFLWLLPTEVRTTVAGLLELSNGCCALAAVEDPSVRFVICSAILAFGGLCVTMQTLSVTKGLSMKYYYTGKFLQTVFSVILSVAFVKKIWVIFPVMLLFFWLLRQKIRKNSSNPFLIGV